jgi:hypothetical protein
MMAQLKFFKIQQLHKGPQEPIPRGDPHSGSTGEDAGKARS